MSEPVWINHAIEIGAKTILIMYDLDDKEEYPVYIMPHDNYTVIKKRLELSEGHQKINKIIPVI
ncbi:MAG: hypothetical protein WC942_09700 [Clostridia bacterium]|jgi:hypothetical protein